MRKKITEKRLISVEGYSAEVNVQFTEWDSMGGRKSYYLSVSEVAKAIKAITKAA